MKRRTPGRATSPDCRRRRRAEGDDRGWRLPSGQTLGEFAMRSGVLAPRLLVATCASIEPLQGLLRRSAED
ncbi:MAG: hypothetical protein ACM3S5_02425 [Rhodospirillales bacterium]